MDESDAKRKAVEALAAKFAGELDLMKVDALPSPAYDFDPDGWALFAVIDSQPRIGGSEYFAVDRATGEVRLLGLLGQ